MVVAALQIVFFSNPFTQTLCLHDLSQKLVVTFNRTLFCVDGSLSFKHTIKR